MENGYDLDYGVRIAKAIEDYADLIHVSAGSWKFGFGKTHPSMFEDHGRNVYLAAEIKKHVSKPVATLGDSTTRARWKRSSHPVKPTS
jgi:2,4-dienoyl-CoA reductase-like NADH-dependent reductase (Old Yellow Enzyme family)